MSSSSALDAGKDRQLGTTLRELLHIVGRCSRHRAAGLADSALEGKSQGLQRKIIGRATHREGCKGADGQGSRGLRVRIFGICSSFKCFKRAEACSYLVRLQLLHAGRTPSAL